MKRLLAILGQAFVYFCTATVLAQAIVLAVLWQKGYLTQSRLHKVLAALYDVDVLAIRDRLVAEAEAANEEQDSYEQQLRRAIEQSLHLDLRETAIEKGFLDLVNLQTAVQTEHDRFAEMRDQYDAKLEGLANVAKDEALQRLQQTLETMQPAQAKDQLLRMFEDGAVEDVVQLLINMPTSKQKKVLAEFQTDEDARQLYEILKRIRLGEPTVSTIREARAELRALGLTPPDTKR